VKLNRLEKALMNNPVRAFIQRRYESRLLERLGGRTEGMRVLEVGCGRGVGTEIIFERFGAREVHAFDLDPDMVNRARRRLSSYGSDRLRISVGDVTAIDADDRSFDAVVDFGILHHVPRWQEGVAEIGRVLKPGGRFYFEEVSGRALNRRAYRALFEYPEENRFSRDEFVRELEGQGIKVGDRVVERLLGDFFFGVGCLRNEVSATGPPRRSDTVVIRRDAL
jgi:ubiquinone/menaquinone biosynthesis C-methylase UbiE